MTPNYSFCGGELTLIRPDSHHHDDVDGSGDDPERERIEEPQKTLERSEANAGEELLFKGTSR